LRAFVEKTAASLDKHIHLLIVDLHPPGKRDPLTLAAYECGLSIRAYVVNVAVADPLTDMPLFVEPEKAVDVPLEATYQAAFATLPRRWQRVLEAPAGRLP
jgi:hypothetical protein